MNRTLQLCPQCKALYQVASDPYRQSRDVKREICCPECVGKLPGKQLAEEFKKK